MKDKLIVAIDVSEENKVKQIVTSLEDTVDIFKVGLEQYISSRGKVLDYLKNKNKKIFLDLKFHDIPNTMEAATRAAVREGVWMLTMHVSDLEGMKRVAQAATEEAEKRGISKPLVVAVTVLTSLGQQDLEDIGCSLSSKELVIKRAKLAALAGLDGVVSSPQEAGLIRKACDDRLITVCPGIRSQDATQGDQKRILSPKDALEAGAHYLVVGRPITQAPDVQSAAVKILKEMEEAKQW